MHYKIEGAIRRNRTNFIICAILWIFLTIVFVSPLAYSIFVANSGGSFDLNIFIETIFKSLSNPFGSFGDVFSNGAGGVFFQTLLYPFIQNTFASNYQIIAVPHLMLSEQQLLICRLE